ncbi:MAG: hypothetical protein ACTS2F_19330 [Thainema sp.]
MNVVIRLTEQVEDAVNGGINLSSACGADGGDEYRRGQDGHNG